jgi:esterase/lipase superfamily enzyme
MCTSIRQRVKVWSWAVGTAIVIVLSGCGQPTEERAPLAKPPETSATGDRPFATPDESGREPAPPDAAVEARPDEPAGAEPLETPTEPPRESKPAPRMFSIDKFDEQMPDPPTAPPGDALPDDPVGEGGPILMRVDDEPATTGPAAERTAPDAADPNKPYEMVTVFYATDRQRLAADPVAGTFVKKMWPVLAGACVVVLLAVIGSRGWHRRRMFTLSGVLCLLTVLWGVYTGRQQLDSYRAAAQRGVRYGNERGELEVGTCQVSIPWTHEVGEIERPSLLRLEVRDDVRKHVVLHETNHQSADEFYQQLRDRVMSAPRPEVFVFVHGYNVTFAGAARRTAQIAYDVTFAGAPIFFSWPSQGGLLKYTVDENNVEWAVPHLKQLLLDVARRSGAESVNLIAHSMGNRALTSALRELQRELGAESALFNQIILAAPDIDAEIFCRDLAPALTSSSNRVTLYASSNDQALVASKQVHGYARAGDSGAGLVVLPGIETIDVSRLNSTSLLGHSYYGSSNPILLDIRQLIEFAIPAAQRHWLLPKAHGELTYWMFEKVGPNAAGDADAL